MNSCQINGSLNSSCQKKQYSFQKMKNLLILIAPTSIHIERFTGCVSDWSILKNDRAIKKFDLVTLVWGAYATIKYLNHPFPDLYIKG